MQDKKAKSGTESKLKVTKGNNEEKVRTKSKSKSKPSPSSIKIKNLNKKLEKIENERNEFKDKLLRKAAEFENYKKRRENEVAQLIEITNAELITALLPILDDYKRCIKSAQESEDFKVLFEGVKLIYKNFNKILENKGVKPIDAVGQSFDPEKHDALLQVDNKEHPSGMVVDEHLKGYVMNERILRHSQVLVSK